jgi:hypothetical protein
MCVTLLRLMITRQMYGSSARELGRIQDGDPTLEGSAFTNFLFTGAEQLQMAKMGTCFHQVCVHNFILLAKYLCQYVYHVSVSTCASTYGISINVSKI